MEVGPNEQEPQDVTACRNSSLIIAVPSIEHHLKHLLVLDMPLAIQSDEESDFVYQFQQTNHKDYLRLERAKNAVLYLNCEVMRKGPKKISLYL